MKLFFTILFFVSGIYLSAQTNISGIINRYARVNVIYYSCPDSIAVDDATGFSAGDSILIIQMKGAVIDTSNTISFGNIIDYDKSGNYELMKIGAISGNTLMLTSSLMKLYDPLGIVQIVSFPSFSDAIVTDTLYPQPWNGYTGGILAFSVSDSLTLNADILADGAGFRGGNVSRDSSSWWTYEYAFDSLSGRGGEKGEGIVSAISYKECGRGPLANGGGGGNDMNTGGGGGSNFGNGGHGGSNCLFTDSLWGLSGLSLDTAINQQKIFLGGGGGGGQQDSSEGTGGGNGGGMIIFRATSLIGNGHFIKANGEDVRDTAFSDGAGGGGAGGTILMNVVNFDSTIYIEARGGKGGDQVSSQCHGNGGGGGGGLFYCSATTLPVNVMVDVSGGTSGGGLCSVTPYSGLKGDSGTVKFKWSMPQWIVTNACPNAIVCAGSVVQIGSVPIPGYQYTWNNGPTGSYQMINPLVDTTYVLIATDGYCHYSYDTVTVNVYPVPVPSFTFNMRCNTVSFNNNSGSNTYLWNFGDGNSSTNVSPTHTYRSDGTYRVDLIITNGNSCSTNVSQQIVVNQDQRADMVYSTTPCDSVYRFMNQSINPIASRWKFGDGGTSNSLNANHTYTQSGSKQVQLITTSQNGCVDTVSQNIFVVIATPPQFDFFIDSCASKVIFTSKSPKALSYMWDFGDNQSSGLKNPEHIYQDQGNYNVTLTVNNNTSCPMSITNSVPSPADGLYTTFIPNSFTPNGDGINDMFKVISKLPCDSYSLNIYDRWGEIVFHTDDPLNFGWDGSHNGMPAAEGIYIYRLMGSRSQKNGNITLTR